jgi:haloalkane dehalogenase
VLMFPELVPTEPNHPSAAAMMSVREALRNWEQPALILFGDSDPVFSPRTAESLAELIPGAEPPEILAGVGHFVQEEAGEEVGRRIADWLG